MYDTDMTDVDEDSTNKSITPEKKKEVMRRR